MNILIHDDKALISDFGLSTQLDDSNSISNSDLKGILAYIDSQCFLQFGKTIKPDKKSDIYSLGVLFWELSSGKPPISWI
ncbi:kinase-like protein [Gigaspora margarita]|uniref:Kinase-like protein n=1 Tax=Gigaspora margarita TaxID=4874 RepID=A0A8H4B1Z9_GIGMA|nr:kinase-like protein [Gigaspora margarita]